VVRQARSEAVQRSMLERREKIAQGMRRALEKTAANLTWKMDAQALEWTLMSPDEDHELEEFLDGLPGLFRASMYPTSPEIRTALEAPVSSRSARRVCCPSLRAASA